MGRSHLCLDCFPSLDLGRKRDPEKVRKFGGGDAERRHWGLGAARLAHHRMVSGSLRSVLQPASDGWMKQSLQEANFRKRHSKESSILPFLLSCIEQCLLSTVELGFSSKDQHIRHSVSSKWR